MNLRPSSNLRIFYRGVAIGLALLLCLPPPDLFAASTSSRSIFSGKRPNYEATRQRNLQELEQRQQMGRPRPQLPAPRRSQVVSLSAVEDLSAVHVPPEYGHVLEAWTPKERGQGTWDKGRNTNDQRLTTSDSPTVILLQDLHTQYDAQKAEGSVLEHLYRTYGVRHVASEGTAAPFALAFFQQFPRAKTDRTLVADAFLRLGEMTGHEYQAITQQLPVQMQGVEEEALYQEHLALFREILAQQAEARQAVEAIGRSLETVGQAVASQSVRQLLADEKRFADDRIPLPQYVELLLRRARGVRLDADALAPSLVGMSRVAQLEATLPPRDLIAQQQQAFLAALQQAVEARGAASQRQRVATLIAQLRDSSVGTAYALERLVASAQEFSIALSDYPAVEAFAEYLHLSHAVQAHNVYPELDRLLKALGEALARSEPERRWWQARHTHRLLADAVSAELTRSQWHDYQASSSNPQALAAFCAEQGQPIAADITPLVAMQPLVARFYELAEQRDRALVENTLRWLEEGGRGTGDKGQTAGGSRQTAGGSGARLVTNDQRLTTNDERSQAAALLIAGGFHTEGITALLRQRQVPYVVVAPTVEGELDQTLYHRLIRGETASLPELVAAARASRRAGTLLPDTSVMTTKSDAAKIWFVAIAAFVLVGAISGVTLNEIITQAPDILGPQAPQFTDLVQHLATQPDLPHDQLLAMLQDAVVGSSTVSQIGEGVILKVSQLPMTTAVATVPIGTLDAKSFLEALGRRMPGRIAAVVDLVWGAVQLQKYSSDSRRSAVIEDRTHEQVARFLLDVYRQASPSRRQDIAEVIERLTNLLTEDPTCRQLLLLEGQLSLPRGVETDYILDHFRKALDFQAGDRQDLILSQRHEQIATDALAARFFEIWRRWAAAQAWKEYMTAERVKQIRQRRADILETPVDQLTIVVTGAAGFVGSRAIEVLQDMIEGKRDAKWLQEALRERGLSEGDLDKVRIVAVDNFSVGNQWKIEAAQRYRPSGSQVAMHRGDFRFDDFIDQFETAWGAKCHRAIFLHFGAYTDMGSSGQAPALVHAVNVVGTLKVEELAVKHAAKYVGVSTFFTVKGPPLADDGTLGLISEQTPQSATHYYGASKAVTEVLTRIAERELGLRQTVVAYPYVIGPMQGEVKDRQIVGKVWLSTAFARGITKYLETLKSWMAGDRRQPAPIPEQLVMFKASQDPHYPDNEQGSANDYLSDSEAAEAALTAIDQRHDGKFVRVGSGRGITTAAFYRGFAERFVPADGEELAQHGAGLAGVVAELVSDHRKC